ncbi:MAG: protease family protein [Actinomycetota bacterium]|nr:protease family protein [Actinomycetota bacterium]
MNLPIPPRADLPRPASPDERPKATWTVYQSLGIFLLGNVVIGQVLIGGIVLFMYGTISAPSDGATTPLLMASLFADVAMVATILVWLRLRHEPIVRLLGVPAPGHWLREIAIGVGAGVALYLVIGFGLSPAVNWVLERLFGQQIAVPNQLSPGLSTSGEVLAAIVAIGVAPLAEELFFRGILFRGLRDRRGFAAAAAVSSVAFGIAHWTGDWRGALIIVLSMMVTGLALAVVYERRKNLVANIAAHATFNVVGVILIFWFPKLGT